MADIPVPGDEMTVRVSSKNRPGYHWAIDEGIEGYLMNQPELFKELCQINIIINQILFNCNIPPIFFHSLKSTTIVITIFVVVTLTLLR